MARAGASLGSDQTRNMQPHFLAGAVYCIQSDPILDFTLIGMIGANAFII